MMLDDSTASSPHYDRFQSSFKHPVGGIMSARGPLVLPVIRSLLSTDDLVEITDLLHRAYRKNAELGFHFVATHQSPLITAERLSQGYPYIAELEGKPVGTITFEFPVEIPHGEYATERPLALFGQFAVDPAIQGMGLGTKLIGTVESHARTLGAEEMCLDTAQGADHLISYYQKLGYIIRSEADWRPEVNYKSWVMVKDLT